MKTAGKAAPRRRNLSELSEDFKGLDPNDPGQWPVAPRIVVCIGLLIATVALAWWFDWKGQLELLERRQNEEVQLRQDWVNKKRQAVNLEHYRRQLEETDRQFGALLKQLPNRAEMDSLLSDINQAGLGRGLQFELFKPGNDVVKDFYAEMPIELRVIGSYHDLGAFASDVARMPRIVTLSNLAIDKQGEGVLKLEARALTYRYLDEEEQARQRQQEKAPGGRR
jgi:type IV pilus assembly protein PilO